MNPYEMVQRSIDYIEDQLKYDIQITDIVKVSFLSRATLYRLFNAFIGCSIKDYVRKRKISEICHRLKNTDQSIYQIAETYGYDNPETFYRVFKAVTGTTPGAYKCSKGNYKFGRVNLVEKNFHGMDSQLQKKYPHISILSELPQYRVASYWCYGPNPEDEGLHVIKKWAKKRGLMKSTDLKDGCRIFGFDTPAFMGRNHGYEWWITLPHDFVIDSNDIVKEKVFDGGMYALITIHCQKDNFNDFFGKLLGAKGSFANWCRESEYGFGFHQYLEEYVEPDDPNVEIKNLYFPISMDASTKEPITTELPPCKVAVFPVEGMDVFDNVWNLYEKWSSEHGVERDIYQVQNEFSPMWTLPSCLYITNPPEDACNQSEVAIRDFTGGRYLKFQTEFTCMGNDLENCMKIYKQKGYTPGDKATDTVIIRFVTKPDHKTKHALTEFYFSIK